MSINQDKSFPLTKWTKLYFYEKLITCPFINSDSISFKTVSQTNRKQKNG